MTAIVMAMEYDMHSTIVDIDTTAVGISRQVIRRLGLEDMIKVKLSAGEKYDYHNFNVIFIAALAGTNSKLKLKICQQIKNTADKEAHIIARSSWKNRRLLYRKLDAEIFEMFQPIVKVDPFNEVVNSVIILKNA